MVRTAGLHLLHRGILRFSTSSHPEALGACYSALWRLPRPDLHRLVDGDLQGTPSAAVKCCVGARAFARKGRRASLTRLADLLYSFWCRGTLPRTLTHLAQT